MDTDRLTASLPKGYRARPFEERDREAWIVERNTWYGPMEQGSAEEWRIWEQMSPDDSLLRFVVEDESGRIAAMANLSNGGAFPHPDGAQSGGGAVPRAGRGQGEGRGLVARGSGGRGGGEGPPGPPGAGAARPPAPVRGARAR